ncbi:hypothetical protein K457DRAFT_1880007 [Linnemannia elongata AG-77]|uniref:Uncharacterized protein n=1 Tax=Linnemannia elongata AG-77 TaxID=1314771 RepID=A0A197JIG9_9FUNG|nr:hypothetical protein K457DRAFT_23565 [Linnemannia elongata AG-77]OAQ24993.1 hypothetical protein K457DRAFT_1880007 [Linnemannia elongata AG-77]
MKFTLFQGLTIFACALMVLSVGIHAQGPSETSETQDMALPCDSDLAIFCSETDSQLETDFDTMLAGLPTEDPDAGNADAGNADAAPARRRSYPVMVKRDLIDDVKNYFKTYWKALTLIAKGEFGEGIFLQLKNSGSWCENSNWFVKAIKAGISKLSGGGLTAICECLYPMVKQYESYDKLKSDVNANDLTTVLSKCSDNLRKQIKDTLKKAGSITKPGGKA